MSPQGIPLDDLVMPNVESGHWRPLHCHDRDGDSDSNSSSTSSGSSSSSSSGSGGSNKFAPNIYHIPQVR